MKGKGECRRKEFDIFVCVSHCSKEKREQRERGVGRGEEGKDTCTRERGHVHIYSIMYT